MRQDKLIEGIIKILRDNINKWAVDDGTKQVKPEYPPVSLDKSMYPRASVDTIGHSPDVENVERDTVFGDVLLEVTVFSADQKMVYELVGDVHRAVLAEHDGDDPNTGDPYLPSWSFESFGGIGDTLQEDTSPGFTRSQKSVEFTFKGVTQV